MIKTQLYSANNPEDLQESINSFCAENYITHNNLIDIKILTSEFRDEESKDGPLILTFSALIIYNEKSKPFANKKENFVVNDPYAQESVLEDEIPF